MPETPDDARAFAIRAHADQRYGTRPYSVHLDEVASIVGADPFLRTVAYLHDVVEDTAVSEDEVRTRFGADVAVAVAGLSDPPGENRKARKIALNLRLRALDAAVAGERGTLIVKAADRLANVRACVRGADPKLEMYRAEHEGIRAAAFRTGLCDELWAELDSIFAD